MPCQRPGHTDLRTCVSPLTASHRVPPLLSCHRDSKPVASREHHKGRRCDELRVLVPQGMSHDDKQAVVDTLSGLASFVNAMYQDRNWITRTDVQEKDLQQAVSPVSTGPRSENC